MENEIWEYLSLLKRKKTTVWVRQVTPRLIYLNVLSKKHDGSTHWSQNVYSITPTCGSSFTRRLAPAELTKWSEEE